MALEEQDHEENKVNSSTQTQPKSPFRPTIFPPLTTTSHAASRRQRVGHAHCRRPKRKNKNGGCCKQVPAMKKDSGCDETDGSEDEKAGVERRIKALQGLVPGGECLGPERLFEQTAEYILALQVQVHALKMLASFFEGLEKDQTKVGA